MHGSGCRRRGHFCCRSRKVWGGVKSRLGSQSEGHNLSCTTAILGRPSHTITPPHTTFESRPNHTILPSFSPPLTRSPHTSPPASHPAATCSTNGIKRYRRPHPRCWGGCSRPPACGTSAAPNLGSCLNPDLNSNPGSYSSRSRNHGKDRMRGLPPPWWQRLPRRPWLHGIGQPARRWQWYLEVLRSLSGWGGNPCCWIKEVHSLSCILWDAVPLPYHTFAYVLPLHGVERGHTLGTPLEGYNEIPDFVGNL